MQGSTPESASAAGVLGRSEQRSALRPTGIGAGVAMGMAGLLHLFLAPIHTEHSIEHGIALFTVGLIDLAWTAAWLRRQSSRLLWMGCFLTALTVGLYTIALFLPLPFEGHPEHLEPFGIATQTFEVLGFLALVAFALMRGGSYARSLLTAAVCVGLAFVSAGIAFGASSLLASLWGRWP